MTATVRSERDRPKIEQERLDGAVVLRPFGLLDAEFVAEVRQVILGARLPVVIDLTGSVLVDPTAVRRLATGWELFQPRMALVSHQPSARQLLARAGLQAHVPIFDTVDDALSALASSTRVVDGWSPGVGPQAPTWAVR